MHVGHLRNALTFALSLSSLPLASGCSSSLWQGVAQGMAAASPAGSAVSAYDSPKLMIFGGQAHKTYLGCLNCSAYAADSVLNQYGEHGSAYQSDSIFNKYGDFGSRYSDYSPCNPYASDPPVIVDGSGNFYGRLTVNAYQAQATRNQNWRSWIAGVCAGR